MRFVEFAEIMESDIIDTICDVRIIVMNFFRNFEYSDGVFDNRCKLNKDLRRYSKLIDKQYGIFSRNVKKLCCLHSLCQLKGDILILPIQLPLPL